MGQRVGVVPVIGDLGDHFAPAGHYVTRNFHVNSPGSGAPPDTRSQRIVIVWSPLSHTSKSFVGPGCQMEWPVAGVKPISIWGIAMPSTFRSSEYPTGRSTSMAVWRTTVSPGRGNTLSTGSGRGDSSPRGLRVHTAAIRAASRATDPMMIWR